MRDDEVQSGRRSIRLPGYDYAQPGGYFVTLVTSERACLFEQAVFRRVAEACWVRIPQYCKGVHLDAWVVMPNHLHGIIVIEGGIALEKPRPVESGPVHGKRLVAPTGGSLGAIVGNYKSVTARRINALRRMPGAAVWQRNYYEHVIRSESELALVRQYIADNPGCWADDVENPHGM